MSEKKSKEPQYDCQLGKCSSGKGVWCKSCGFNEKENERRKALPLVKGPNGLSIKYVGVDNGSTE